MENPEAKGIAIDLRTGPCTGSSRSRPFALKKEMATFRCSAWDAR